MLKAGACNCHSDRRRSCGRYSALSDPSDLAALLERHVQADEVDLASLAPLGRCAAAPLCRSQSSCCHALDWLNTNVNTPVTWSMDGTTNHNIFPK